MYSGRYCEYCFKHFEGKTATQKLLKHIYDKHQKEFKKALAKYLPLAIKIANPIIQRGLQKMRNQTAGLLDIQVMLDPRLVDILIHYIQVRFHFKIIKK